MPATIVEEKELDLIQDGAAAPKDEDDLLAGGCTNTRVIV